jgi:shikimate 5-dehydrogenase
MPAEANYLVQAKNVPTFYFVGVTTGKSAIQKVFPRWMEVLGHPEIVLEGVDHKLHDDPEAYRGTVAQIKYDPLSLGGLVTSHKINLLNAARDMFDELHDSAVLTGEISCISKRGEQLWGHAKDPLTSGLSLDAALGEGYFKTNRAQVLSFGAGGSGKAIALHLISNTDPGARPEKVIFVDRIQAKLDNLRVMAESIETDIEFHYIANNDPKINDEIMENLPDGSVVVNATGAGKDFPGSPVTNQGCFPRQGAVWEINYRGELDFWHQAMSQKDRRDLTIEDGWLYFLHGWTQVVAEVLHIDLDADTFNNLADAAKDLRPRLVYRPLADRVG